MNDIAAQAGVAQSTVSYILNGQHAKMGISEDTRRRVQATASALGYRRNGLALAMVTGRNQVLAVVVGHPEHEPVGSMLRGILEAADNAGYTVKVLHCGNPDTENDCLDRCFELRVAGIITLHARPALLRRLCEEGARHGVPIASLDSTLPQPGGVRVISDDRQGMALAVDHLVDLGHKTIGLLSVSNDGAASFREAAFHQALQRHGMGLGFGHLIRTGGYWNDAQAEAAVDQLLSSPTPPTALICVGDALALVAMRTARRLGVEVPGGLSVIGYSDLAMAQRADPPLTTVAQPFAAMGREVVRHTVAAINAAPADAYNQSTLVDPQPTSLVVRQSTAPPALSSERGSVTYEVPVRRSIRKKAYATT